MSAEHTPTPWRVDGANIHAGAGYRPVMIQSCWIDGSMDDEPEAIANRALIVEAVNSHAALVARVAALNEAVRSAEEALRTLGVPGIYAAQKTLLDVMAEKAS